ncbi:myosin regulatory light chain, smooth muscle-like isoform X1 [Bacillus rossius redtenbacheri]|uniref:myosin regulatory light chain, smooth muscle-like isoform X1 n=1 Tax=Bacillus rossius redtenbacheri TaxID=93214 RepID=UPI002FDE7D4B
MEPAAPGSLLQKKKKSGVKKSDLPAPEEGSAEKETRTKRRTSEAARHGAQRSNHILQDLDDDKLRELKEAFQLFDLDQDGMISFGDLKQTFITLGQTDIGEKDLLNMLSEASNPLDFDAFVQLLGYRTVELDPEEVLMNALAKWDVDNSGLISEERIKHDLMTWGDKFTAKEVEIALEDAPLQVDKRTGAGSIDYTQFCKILCGLRKKTRDPVVEDFLKH